MHGEKTGQKAALAICLLSLLVVQDVQAEETKENIQKAQITTADQAGGAVAALVDTQVGKKKEQGERSEFVEKYIAGRLQLGTRSGIRVLTDDDSGHKGGVYGSGTFLGTIYALDAVQDPLPKYFYLRYLFSKYLGFELAYDSVTAETVATSIGYSGTKSDGDVSVFGPTVSLVASIPNKTRFTPYASFGLGFYSGDFDESNHWGLGYSDPSVYEELGSPTTAYNGKTREMEIDSEVGLTFGFGCTSYITDHWLVDVSMQYTSVDVDATFYSYLDGVVQAEQTGHFPLDNVFFRLGVAYTF